MNEFKQTNIYLINELVRLVNCENFNLLCYLCDQHDIDTSIVAFAYLTKKKPIGADSLLDLQTVKSMVSPTYI